jgi:hypothetical protein
MCRASGKMCVAGREAQRPETKPTGPMPRRGMTFGLSENVAATRLVHRIFRQPWVALRSTHGYSN